MLPFLEVFRLRVPTYALFVGLGAAVGLSLFLLHLPRGRAKGAAGWAAAAALGALAGAKLLYFITMPAGVPLKDALLTGFVFHGGLLCGALAGIAAARALRWGGRLYLVHKPERLADLMVFLRAARLEPKRLRFVRHSAASAVSLVLLEARLGGKPGLQIEPELVLYGPDGSESAACRRIYHRQE